MPPDTDAAQYDMWQRQQQHQQQGGGGSGGGRTATMRMLGTSYAAATNAVMSHSGRHMRKVAAAAPDGRSDWRAASVDRCLQVAGYPAHLAMDVMRRYTTIMKHASRTLRQADIILAASHAACADARYEFDVGRLADAIQAVGLGQRRRKYNMIRIISMIMDALPDDMGRQICRPRPPPEEEDADADAESASDGRSSGAGVMMVSIAGDERVKQIYRSLVADDTLDECQAITIARTLHRRNMAATTTTAAAEDASYELRSNREA